MKVLVADAFERSGIEALTAAGAEVVFDPELANETLAAAIRREQPDVLVVRGSRVGADMLEGSSIGLIVRAGAGLNTIDVDAARRLGVAVENCPGLNAIAVAELTFALLLAIDRRIVDNAVDLRAGRWNKREYSRAAGLHGRTLGIIGFGRIGEEVARRAHAFGMQVAAWSRRFRSVPPALTLRRDPAGPDPDVRVIASLEELAEQSDVLSVHLALTDETRGLVGANVFRHVRRRAIFVNTARAEIVDASALAAAIRDRGVRAGLDVFAAEPVQSQGTFADPLVALPGVIGTHHIGGSTDQAQEAIAQEVVRIIQHWSRRKS